MSGIETNTFDRLLYYLSHKGELSWADFKQAIKVLTDGKPDYKMTTYLKALARLGHLDYDPMNLSYVTIAPAALVETQVENRYVLVGSRVPAFLEDVRLCVSENGGEFRLRSKEYAPAIVVLNHLTEETFSALEGLGVYISREFSTKLSRILPRPKFLNLESEPVSILRLEKKFNSTTLGYESVGHGERTDGLYEISQHGPNIYVLKHGDEHRKVPRDWAEWYILLGTSGLTAYDQEAQTWSVSTEVPVPLIVDRCAALCSGYPPKLTFKSFCYSDVPVDIAERLTKSLYQDWEAI